MKAPRPTATGRPGHPRVATADWVYLRYHGGHYSGSYARDFLRQEARRIAALLAEGLDVYAYFNNDAQGFAVENALDLKRFVEEVRGKTVPARSRAFSS